MNAKAKIKEFQTRLKELDTISKNLYVKDLLSFSGHDAEWELLRKFRERMDVEIQLAREKDRKKPGGK